MKVLDARLISPKILCNVYNNIKFRNFIRLITSNVSVAKVFLLVHIIPTPNYVGFSEFSGKNQLSIIQFQIEKGSIDLPGTHR